jgi:hypothetical protein
MCESVDLIPLVESEALVLEMPIPEEMYPETVELVEFLANVPKVAVTASITKVFGPCPLGMMPGNAWKIGPDGKLSRNMCRPGATALSALFRMADGDAIDRSTACECVYAGIAVTFTVREAEGDPMETPG